jgi:hypothetical protein
LSVVDISHDEVVRDGGKAGYGGEQSVATMKLTMVKAKLIIQKVKPSTTK